jgi:hypothetical protein
MEYGILEVDKRDFGLYLIYSGCRRNRVLKLTDLAVVFVGDVINIYY